MKICNNCNKVESDSAIKCSNCGRTSFREVLIDIDELDEEIFAEKERKRKKKLILSLLTLFVIFLILILITVIKVKQDANNGINSYGQSKRYNSIQITSSFRPGFPA